MSFTITHIFSDCIILSPWLFPLKTSELKFQKAENFIALKTSNKSHTKTRVSKNLKPGSRKMPKKNKKIKRYTMMVEGF